MLKCISQIKRLSTPLPKCESFVFRDTVRNVRIQSVDEVTQRVTYKVVKKTVNRPEEMRAYRVSDFCLDNLVALGVQMSPTHMTASPHKAMTDMLATLENVNLDSNPE